MIKLPHDLEAGQTGNETQTKIQPGLKFCMKKTVFIVGAMMFAAFTASAGIYHNGPASPSAATRQGWIDLDKNGKKDVYEDPARPVAARVDDLLKRMTLDEKIGQLEQAAWGYNPVQDFTAKIKRGEIGSFLDGSGLIESPVTRNQLQHIAIEQSRLGIPLIMGADVIHGFRTTFPIPLAEACAWDPELFKRTEAIAAREAA